MSGGDADAVAPPSLRHNGDFARLWLGQAVSVLGSRISWVAFPLLVLSLTHSPAKAGIVGFAGSLPALLLGVPAGALADRWRRRWTMAACDGLRALVLGSLALTVALGEATFAQVAAAAFCARSASTLFDPAELASIQRVVPAARLPEAVARNESREYGAFLAGPAAGGALYAAGRALPFLADAVSYCASLVAVLLIRTDLGPDARLDVRSSFVSDMREGLRHTWRTPFLRTAILIVAGSNFVSNGVALTLILVVRERGASAATVGLMLTVSAIGGLLGSFVAPTFQRRWSPLRAVTIAACVWTAATALFPLDLDPFAVAALLAVMMFAGPTLNAILVARQIASVPNRLQARVEGAASVLSTGAIAFSALAAGFMLDRLGATAAIETFAALMALLALTILGSAAVRNGLAPPDRTAGGADSVQEVT